MSKAMKIMTAIAEHKKVKRQRVTAAVAAAAAAAREVARRAKAAAAAAERKALREKLVDGAQYRQLFVRCGSKRCSRCKAAPTHGPYWYAEWVKDGRKVTRYVGKRLPPGVAAYVAELGAPEARAAAAEELANRGEW